MGLSETIKETNIKEVVWKTFVAVIVITLITSPIFFFLI